MNTAIFREYDIRGVAERYLGDALVRDLGRGLAAALGADLGRAPRVVVGRDCRLSGPRLVAALTEGLRDGGAHVVDIGIGPTPMVYFAVHHLDTDGGVMVTGSHNPGDENGFKIMRGKASFFGEEIQALRRSIEAHALPSGKSGGLEHVSVEEAYLGALVQGITLERPAFGVVVDAGNGAAGPLALRALRAIGLDPVALYCEMDGTFPNHHPDPTVPENLRVLARTVEERGARVGIAFDGDGDRLGVIDPSGELVFGDRLLALFARSVLREHPGATVIGEVKCSGALFQDIERAGGRPILWKTGHSLIKSKMKEAHALLAGEMSGHFFFADRYFGYDDGIYAALRLVEILAREGRTVSELLADLPRACATPEIRVACPDAIKRDVVARVRDHFGPRYRTIDIDGIRLEHEDGAWALVRASNTGPVIVLRFEAPTEARLSEVQAEVEGALGEARRAIEGGAG
jgi:phosphomannomutase / phosphoglucomutase